MKKLLIVSLLGLAALLLIMNCEKPLKLEKADMDYVKETLGKFAPVTIAYDKSILSEKDQLVVEKLVQAANYMNKIFLRQVFAGNEEIKKALEKSTNQDDKPYLELFKHYVRTDQST